MNLDYSNFKFGLSSILVLILFFSFAYADEVGVDNSTLQNSISNSKNFNSSNLDKGMYVVKSLAACGSCHGLDPANPDSPLSGGLVLEDGFGKVIAPNITSDKETGIGNWTQLELQHAIRSSIGKNGELLSIDSHQSYRWISDDDVNAISTYLLNTDSVSKQHERRSVSSFSARKWGLFKQHAIVKGYIPDVPKRSKGYYGMYVVNNLANCSRCHSPSESSLEKPTFLAGSNGSPFLSTSYFDIKPHPIAPNIRNDANGILDWTDNDIVSYLGAHKSQELSQSVFCPTSYYSNMSEQDKLSVGVYLRSLK